LAKKKKKAKGVLPSYTWIRKNGLSGLCSYMYKHPEIFEHIDQEKFIKFADEYVKIAEELEKKYGVLPKPKWLKENGHTNLTSCMLRNPLKFAHITQEKSFKKINEYVKIAEDLEKKYGTMPRYKWLRENGYTNLAACKIKYPERFAHIKQDNCLRTLNEWVKFAEDLEDEHGILPNAIWVQNKYSGLYKNILLYPEQFTHIKQEKLQKTVDEWVKIAEEMEKQYGKLPNPSWLQKNGFDNLYNCKRRHPEKFSHIKQFKVKEFKEVLSIG